MKHILTIEDAQDLPEIVENGDIFQFIDSDGTIKKVAYEEGGPFKMVVK